MLSHFWILVHYSSGEQWPCCAYTPEICHCPHPHPLHSPRSGGCGCNTLGHHRQRHCPDPHYSNQLTRNNLPPHIPILHIPNCPTLHQLHSHSCPNLYNLAIHNSHHPISLFRGDCQRYTHTGTVDQLEQLCEWESLCGIVL